MKHVSVLQKEILESLNLKKNGLYVDCTLGRGGHSLSILNHLSKEGRVLAFDKDAEAISFCKKNIKYQNIEYIKSDFKHLLFELKCRNIKKVDGIIFDLGLSSPQIYDHNRGFSYKLDGPLDMRMDTTNNIDAKYIINNYEAKKLASIFYEYGNEKFANKIANKIVDYRKQKPILRTLELVDIIKSAIPQYILKTPKHPAKKVFQSLRIEVNQEITTLKTVLIDAAKLLKVNGVLSVITFHSLEDSIVKNIFNKLTKYEEKINFIKIPNNKIIESEFKLSQPIFKKPNIDEIKFNSRSRSAKLRTIIRIKDEQNI